MSLPPIDHDAIASIRSLAGDDGDDFLREIIGIYLSDTPGRLAELDEAFLRGDAAKFARAAHSIKGSSANVGAQSLRAEAEALEHRSRENLAGAGAAIETLRQEFERTRQALEALLPPLR